MDNSEMNPSDPATKQDILDLATRLERAENTLLKEFRVYARMQATKFYDDL